MPEPVSLDDIPDDDDVSLLGAVLAAPLVLSVPLAPMLDVPEPYVPELVLALGVVLDVELLGVEVLVPLVPDAPMVLELFLLASVALLVPEALVPPAPPEPDVPELPDCAKAMPPTARAAAAARVVSVFLVDVMCLTP